MDQSYQAIIDELNQYLLNTYGEKTHLGGDKTSLLNEVSDVNLDPKVKEMIALSLGIAVRCEGCIESHTRNLKELGVQRKELLALLGMAVYIGGGASMMYAADALKVFNDMDMTDKA